MINFCCDDEHCCLSNCCSNNYPCCCRGETGPIGPTGPTGPIGSQGPSGENGKSAYQIALDNGFIGTEADWLESLRGETGPTGPFLSSYLEAVGYGQSVESQMNVVFSTDEDEVDIVGNDITLNTTGSIFTLNRPGLYHIEWSLNLGSGTQPVVICLMENGSPSSPISNSLGSGTCTSGALINVTASQLPYVVTLNNFGNPITIAEPLGYTGTAVSMRILRFADGPSS